MWIAKGILLGAWLFTFGTIATQKEIPPPADYDLALALVRHINSSEMYFFLKDHHHVKSDEALKYVLTHKTKPGSLDEALMKQIQVSDEPIAGWHLDLALTNTVDPKGEFPTGYRLILKGPRSSLISDETGVIYATPITNLPAASELPSASQAPGAVPYGEFKASTSK